MHARATEEHKGRTAKARRGVTGRDPPSAKRASAARREQDRAYHHGNLRRELLDAAIALFAERGSLDFTLRELARAVGVTHSAPYRHFESKQELIAALRQEVFARLAERERHALSRAGANPRARVRALGEAYVRFAITEPVAFRLVLAHPVEGQPAAERGGDTSDAGEESYRLLVTAIEDARTAGVARTDLSARELALAAWSLVHGLASLLASGRVPVSESRVKRYAELLDAVFFDGARGR